MTDILPATFMISDHAKAEIARLRSEYERSVGKRPIYLCVAWGLYQLKSGQDFQRPVVSFYDEDDADGVKFAVQVVSGLELVYFTTAQYHHHFHARVLDHSAENSFFLREA